ncbi:hypothetical protein J6590_019748 [Homalodisca vitripennis]|nr:hypothetical protein J6590_019748 [Homalodisca vitripennis]
MNVELSFGKKPKLVAALTSRSSDSEIGLIPDKTLALKIGQGLYRQPKVETFLELRPRVPKTARADGRRHWCWYGDTAAMTEAELMSDQCLGCGQ